MDKTAATTVFRDFYREQKQLGHVPSDKSSFINIMRETTGGGSVYDCLYQRGFQEHRQGVSNQQLTKEASNILDKFWRSEWRKREAAGEAITQNGAAASAGGAPVHGHAYDSGTSTKYPVQDQRQQFANVDGQFNHQPVYSHAQGTAAYGNNPAPGVSFGPPIQPYGVTGGTHQPQPPCVQGNPGPYTQGIPAYGNNPASGVPSGPPISPYGVAGGTHQPQPPCVQGPPGQYGQGIPAYGNNPAPGVPSGPAMPPTQSHAIVQANYAHCDSPHYDIDARGPGWTLQTLSYTGREYIRQLLPEAASNFGPSDLAKVQVPAAADPPVEDSNPEGGPPPAQGGQAAKRRHSEVDMRQVIQRSKRSTNDQNHCDDVVGMDVADPLAGNISRRKVKARRPVRNTTNSCRGLEEILENIEDPHPTPEEIKRLALDEKVDASLILRKVAGMFGVDPTAFIQTVSDVRESANEAMANLLGKSTEFSLGDAEENLWIVLAIKLCNQQKDLDRYETKAQASVEWSESPQLRENIRKGRLYLQFYDNIMKELDHQFSILQRKRSNSQKTLARTMFTTLDSLLPSAISRQGELSRLTIEAAGNVRQFMNTDIEHQPWKSFLDRVLTKSEVPAHLKQAYPSTKMPSHPRVPGDGSVSSTFCNKLSGMEIRSAASSGAEELGDTISALSDIGESIAGDGQGKKNKAGNGGEGKSEEE